MLNGCSAIIARPDAEGPLYTLYLVGNGQCISLARSSMENSIRRSLPYNLDPHRGMVVFKTLDGVVQIKDMMHSEETIAVPCPSWSPRLYYTSIYMQSSDKNITVSYMMEENKRAAEKAQDKCFLQQWHYDVESNLWKARTAHPVSPFHELKPFMVNSHNTVAIGIVPNRIMGVSGNLRTKPYIVRVDTGERIRDVYDKESSSVPTILMASNNGGYIATQLVTGDVCVWKVRGSNLSGHCTFTDRIDLRELDQLYRIGQERNEKYDRNYVIRLDPTRWGNFQQLSQRPECEVPHDWARLFRQLKTSK